MEFISVDYHARTGGERAAAGVSTVAMNTHDHIAAWAVQGQVLLQTSAGTVMGT